MAFGDSMKQAKTAGGSGTYDSIYLRLKPGTRTVRILDPDAHSFWQYWIEVNVNGMKQGRGIVVGGADNPIKRYMNTLGEDHPQYRKPSRQFALNVIDRTPVIINDGVATYPDENGRIAPGARPSNRTMIMTFGTQLMDQMIGYDGRMRNPATGAPMRIQEFDLSIDTRGKGRDTVRVIIPVLVSDEPMPEELLLGERYNLQEAFRPMPEAAQEALVSGEDYITVIKELGWSSIKPLW